jgi:Uma2 family endonuclease
MMAEPAVSGRMTVDEFIDWATAQPGGRYELAAGKVYAMSPERVGHARTKARVWRELDREIAAAGLVCETLPDGLTVPIDAATSYEPDVLVRCGEPLDPEAVKVVDPVTVVEVVSRSSRGLDAGMKLADYFRVQSIAHYLLIDTSRAVITHHAQDAAGGIRTSVHHDGQLRLDPPGIEVAVAGCLPDAPLP